MSYGEGFGFSVFVLSIVLSVNFPLHFEHVILIWKLLIYVSNYALYFFVTWFSAWHFLMFEIKYIDINWNICKHASQTAVCPSCFVSAWNMLRFIRITLSLNVVHTVGYSTTMFPDMPIQYEWSGCFSRLVWLLCVFNFVWLIVWYCF